MVLHPAVQAKAQAELDAAIGPGRLPDYNDRSSLPYINAIVKEVLRWNPVAPLGDYSPPMVMINGIDFFFLRSSSYGYQGRHL
jgi:cytochrome P450